MCQYALMYYATCQKVILRLGGFFNKQGWSSTAHCLDDRRNIVGILRLHPTAEGILMHVFSLMHTDPNGDNKSKDSWNYSKFNSHNDNKQGCHFLLSLASCFIPHVY